MTHTLPAPNRNEPSVQSLPKPTFDRTLILPYEEKLQVNIPGFIRPEGFKEKPSQGVIKAVGPGRVANDGERIKVEFKVGQNVVFNRFSGTEINFDGNVYLIVPEGEIICVL